MQIIDCQENLLQNMGGFRLIEFLNIIQLDLELTALKKLSCNVYFVSVFQYFVNCHDMWMAHFAEENGLSAGWVFIILLSILVCLYCSCGMGYKYKMIGVTGVEAIPNVDFWRSYPGLVKDGVAFTVSKVQQCAAKGGGGGAYSNVNRSNGGTPSDPY